VHLLTAPLSPQHGRRSTARPPVPPTPRPQNYPSPAPPGVCLSTHGRHRAYTNLHTYTHTYLVPITQCCQTHTCAARWPVSAKSALAPNSSRGLNLAASNTCSPHNFSAASACICVPHSPSSSQQALHYIAHSTYIFGSQHMGPHSSM
jgi:hypothetical protein